MSAGIGGVISGTAPGRPFSAQLIVDGTAGNDASAARYGAPAKTLTKAKALAQSGDTILVLPGTYLEHDLLKDGVNWFFLPGAIVTWTDDQTAVGGRAIFDDIASACTSKILGSGKFNYTIAVAGTFVTGGVVALIQATSDVQFQCLDCTTTGGAASSQAAFYLKNYANFSLDFNSITDPAFGAGTSFPSGIYWEKGTTYIRGKIIKMDANAVWCNEPAGSPSTNLYADVQHFESNWQSAVYFTGKNPNWKTWISCNQIVGSAVGGIFAQGGGKLYVNAQKVSCVSAPAITLSGVAAPNNPFVWITSQKITSATGWVTATASYVGTAQISCMEYEDSTGIATGFAISSGTIIFHGGVAKVLNGIGLLATGGTIRCKGMVIDTTNTNAVGNVPVKLNVNTVMLDNCTLLAPAAAAAVTTVAAAQTFKNYGTKGTTALNVNATVLGGDAYAADANVT